MSRTGCATDCTCKRHGKPVLPREEILARKRARMAAARIKNPDRQVDIRYRSAFGITLDDYNRLLAAQGNRCAICGTDTPGGKGRFPVDHDHACCPGKRSCGKCVRALLCTRCNVGIAMFRDNTTTMQSAIAYLEGSDDVQFGVSDTRCA